MKKLILLVGIILLAGCTTSVTYYKPIGPGRLYGSCNTPMHLLKHDLIDGVKFAVLSYPSEKIHGIYVYGAIEVPAGNIVSVLVPEITIESGSDHQIRTIKIDKFESDFIIKDNNGEIVRVEKREISINEPLVGYTYPNSGLKKLIQGDEYQTYEIRFYIENYNYDKFIIRFPDLLINDNKVSMSPIEFNLTTDTILWSPC